jgi:hypothetical protein
MSRSTPDFAAVLRKHFSPEALDLERASSFALDRSGRLAFVNQAWDQFAEGNGADAAAAALSLGAPYLDAIAEPLRPFYRDLLARAPERDASLRPATHEYECSSATTFRTFLMHVYLLPGAAGHLIVNSLGTERPHDREEHPPDLTIYLDASVGGEGVVRQCSHCRRIQQVQDLSRWDWVPDWVSNPPGNSSHTLCPICFTYYYPEGNG